VHLETLRLVIRDLEVADVPGLVKLWTDPDATRYMGGPRDEAGLRASLEEDLEGDAPRFDLWPALDKASGELVGHCGLLEKSVDGVPEIELVYVLARAAWGRGLGTEAAGRLRDYAFTELGLGRLIALIDPENIASGRVATKLGFRLEKTTVRPGGRLMHVYALAKPEVATDSSRDEAVRVGSRRKGWAQAGEGSLGSSVDG